MYLSLEDYNRKKLGIFILIFSLLACAGLAFVLGLNMRRPAKIVTKVEEVEVPVYVYRDGYTIAGEGATVYCTLLFDDEEAMDCVRPDCEYVEILAEKDTQISGWPDDETHTLDEIQ